MAVRAGYKQTEIGIVPEDWEMKRLGDECELITKGTTPTSLGKDFTNNGINFIKVETLNSEGKILHNMVAFIDEETHKLLKRSQLKEGDLLISIAGALGRTGIVRQEILPANTNQALAIVRLSIGAQISLLYIYHYLKTEIIKKHIQGISVQGAQANLSLQNIADLSICAPDLPEQEAIAAALSDADALIAALEGLIAKKRQIKQGAMQELLTGKKRLAGFEKKHGYKQTEVGIIPEDWHIYALGEIGKFKNGINKGSEAFGQGTPFVNLMDIFGVSSLASTKNLGLVTCSSVERSIYDLRRGDLIFIRSSVKPSGVGLTAVVENDLPETVYSGFLIRFRDGGAIDIGYKRYCFYEERFRKSVIDSSTVSANANINQVSLKQLCIPLPPTITEQTAIAEILCDMDAEIDMLAAKLSKARQVKQGMMSELLTGKVRLV
jgi:type I restriction enzyme, S subunit